MLDIPRRREPMNTSRNLLALMLGMGVFIGCGKEDARIATSPPGEHHAATMDTAPAAGDSAQDDTRAEQRSSDTARRAGGSVRQSPFIHVDELMKHPEQYPGEIAIVGVVSETDSDRQLVRLIDEGEFDACRELGCAALVLPVRWTGVMPEKARRVKVSGRIVRSDNGLLFSVDKMASATE
jgi:hypothetical protein